MAGYWVHSDPGGDDGHWRDAGMRECARGERCADPRLETVDGKMARLPAQTPRAFCESDRNLIEQCLRDLPGLEVRVHAEIGSRSRVYGPRVSTSRTPPVPINLDVDELLRDLAQVLVSWHERVADVARLSAPDGTVRAACAVLAPRVDVLLALPAEPMTRPVWLRDAAALPAGTLGLVHATAGYADTIQQLSGADAGLEVLNLHFRCRRLLGETRAPARHLPAPCAMPCGYKQLFEVLDGDGQWDGARCRQCGTQYTLEEYRDLAAEAGDTLRRAGARRRTAAVAGAWDDVEARRA